MNDIFHSFILSFNMYENLVIKYLIDFLICIQKFIDNKNNSKYVILWSICIIILIFKIIKLFIWKNIKYNNSLENYFNNFKKDKDKVFKLNNSINVKKISIEKSLKIQSYLMIFMLFLSIFINFLIYFLTNKYNVYNMLLFNIIFNLVTYIFCRILNFINKKLLIIKENKLKSIKENEAKFIQFFLHSIDKDFKIKLKLELYKNSDLIINESLDYNQKDVWLKKKYLKSKIKLKILSDYNKCFKNLYYNLSSFDFCEECFSDIENFNSQNNNITNKEDNNKCIDDCFNKYLDFSLFLDNELKIKIKEIQNKYLIKSY